MSVVVHTLEFITGALLPMLGMTSPHTHIYQRHKHTDHLFISYAHC